jgi:hypothetical protein
VSALLLAVLILAAFLRFRGIAFGLPQTNCRPDENHLVETASRVADGEFNPHYYRKPTLLAYADAALFRLASPVLRPAGSTFEQAIQTDPGSFYLLARLLSACLGTLTVLLVYHLGRLVSGPRAGLIASFFFAVSPLAMRDSHFATVDTALVFFLSASLLCLLHSSRAGSRRLAFAAAALTGFAAAVKYTGVVGLLPLLAAGWMFPPQTPSSLSPVAMPRGRARAGRMAALFGIALAAFAAGAPFVFLDWRGFLPTIPSFAEQMRTGHYGMTIGPHGWTWHPTWTLPIALGLAVSVLAAAGLASALPSILRGADPLRLLVLLAIAGTYLVIGPQRVLFARYVLPMLPGLCLFASDAVLLAASRAGSGALRAAAAGALALAASAGPTVRSFQIDRLLTIEDTRLAARRWITKEIADGSRILLVRRMGWRIKSYGNPQPDDPSLATFEGLVTSTPGEGAPREPEVDPASRGVAAVQADSLDELVAKADPDFVVLHRSPLLFYSVHADAIEQLSRRGTLAHEESPWLTPEDARPAGSRDYDQQDAFFLPLRRFEGIGRPGPDVLVFRMERSSGSPAPGTE